MSVDILTEENYKSSTVTMVATLDKSLRTRTVAEYLPVVHLFNPKGERIKLGSGTRDGINFFGINNIIITSCYKDIRRGVRLGAMNNMICSDLQILDKNVHIKLSETIITSVGTCGYETGKKAFMCMINHLNNLKSNIEYFQALDTEEQDIIYSWIEKNCISHGKLMRLSELPSACHIDKRALGTLLIYIDDFNDSQASEYMTKIKNIKNMENIFEGVLGPVNPKLYNSVYHIKICDKDERLYLHRMAAYLLDKHSISVEFHNWKSEGAIICFPVDNNNELNTHDKEYKHRFTVYEKSSMRQCSPGKKEESYKYYKGVMKLIKEFVDNGQNYDGFKKYISEESRSI
jgi:hypothetical protein